jgi:hypothetical protein
MMEYTFKNTDGIAIRIELKEFQLVVRDEFKEKIIPYSAITDVSLDRNRNSFFLEIRSIDFGSVQINYRLSANTNDMGQAKQYIMFVRTLHFHLIKSQCPAEFYAGFKPSNLVEKISVVSVLSGLAYFLEDYFDFSPLSPMMLVILVLGLGAILIFSSYLKKSPKSYKPTDIPLTMLPPAT